MRRKIAVFVISLGAVGAVGLGLSHPAHATTVPAVCVHQPTPFGQIEVGYCPNG